MQTSVNPIRQRHRTWLIPAIVAAILFLGAVASNLIANYLQPSVEPYRRWVWVSFGIALVVAIAVAIREARRSTHPPSWSGEPQPESARREVAVDVVARDKITYIHEAVPVATALHQLPPPVIDFTGRDKELSELTAKLEQSGVTISGLHGLGGIGKTALALNLGVAYRNLGDTKRAIEFHEQYLDIARERGPPRRRQCAGKPGRCLSGPG